MNHIFFTLAFLISFHPSPTFQYILSLFNSTLKIKTKAEWTREGQIYFYCAVLSSGCPGKFDLLVSWRYFSTTAFSYYIFHHLISTQLKQSGRTWLKVGFSIVCIRMLSVSYYRVLFVLLYHFPRRGTGNKNLYD